MEATGLQRGVCHAANVHVKREARDAKQSALGLGSQGSPALCSDPAYGGGRGGLDHAEEELLLGPSALHAATTTTDVQLPSVISFPPPPGSDFCSEAVICLIDAVCRRWGLYETRERSQLFQSVQEELASKGHLHPVEKIRRKWNNLIVTYKRVKERSQEKGHAKTSWEFYDLMDAMLNGTMGSYININKRSKGGGAKGAHISAKAALRLHVPQSTTLIHPNGSSSIHVDSGVMGQAAAGSSSSVRQTDSPDLKPLIVLSSDLVPAKLHLASTDPAQSFISSPCFSQAASPSLVPTINTDPNASRRAPSFQTDVVCFGHSNNLASNFPTTCSSLSSLVSASATSAPEGHKAQSGSSVYQEIVKQKEAQTDLDGAARARMEARERRQEKREVRMGKSLCRIATALELLSSKQDTVIALLQRLADKK